MAEVKLELSQEMVNGTLGAAVLSAIGQAGIDKIVKAAIDHLVTPTSSTYGRGTSPLMDIVGNVARSIASDILTAKLNNDEAFQSGVRDIYEQASRKFLNIETREQLVNKVAFQMAAAFSKDNY